MIDHEPVFPPEEIKSLPCITEKCISYPICINKRNIQCKILEEYVFYLICYYNESIFRSHGLYYLPNNMKLFVWDIVRNHLKNARLIMLGKYPFLYQDVSR